MKFSFSFLVTLLFAFQTNAQVSSLSICYHVGYDCSQEADNEDGYVRGACWHEETLQYIRKKNSFATNRMATLSLFSEWNEGLQPNSIRDSLFVKHLFRRRKLPAAALENYLVAITQLSSDSILQFDPADFSEDQAFIDRCRDSAARVAVYIDPDPLEKEYSTVMPWLRIRFTLNDTAYTLWQDAYNHFWELEYVADGNERSFYFVHTSFDALLAEHLSKRFDGFEIVSNRKLEADLKEWLGFSE